MLNLKQQVTHGQKIYLHDLQFGDIGYIILPYQVIMEQCLGAGWLACWSILDASMVDYLHGSQSEHSNGMAIIKKILYCQFHRPEKW